MHCIPAGDPEFNIMDGIYSKEIRGLDLNHVLMILLVVMGKTADRRDGENKGQTQRVQCPLDGLSRSCVEETCTLRSYLLC